MKEHNEDDPVAPAFLRVKFDELQEGKPMTRTYNFPLQLQGQNPTAGFETVVMLHHRRALRETKIKRLVEQFKAEQELKAAEYEKRLQEMSDEQIEREWEMVSK